MNIQLMKHGMTLLLGPITNIFRMQNKWKFKSLSNIVQMYPLPYPIHVISMNLLKWVINIKLKPHIPWKLMDLTW